MESRLGLLKKKIEEAPVIEVGKYRYFINPLQGIPAPVEPELLAEVVDEIALMPEIKEADLIVCIEAMSIGLGYALSIKVGKPIVIVRKKEFPLEGKTLIKQKTGYSEGNLFLYGDYAGKKVVIVDDLLSTGGTLLALVKALKEKGADVLCTAVVMERGDGKKELEKAGIKVNALCRVEVGQKGQPKCILY